MKKIFYLLTLVFLSCSTTKVKPEYSNTDNIAEFNQFIKDFEKEYIYLKDKYELWNCMKNTYSKKSVP